MSEYEIVIPDLLKSEPDIEQFVLGDGCKIRVLARVHEEEILDDIASADALMVWHEITIGQKAISRLTRCKVIVRYGVGFDNIDLRAAGSKGIPVYNVPDYGTNDVADHTLALLLHLVRGLGQYNSSVQRGNDGWDWSMAGRLFRLTDKCLGIIGLGRIGTAVALRAKAFGLHVVFYDPYVPDGIDKALGLQRLELPQLLSQSDMITFHCPLTDETHNMANAAFFSEAKQGVVIVNTARGAVIDFGALEHGLRGGKVACAGLDVLPAEPPDGSNPLVKAWRENQEWIRHRLVITPHCAFYSHEAFEELRRKTALTVKRVLNGERPRNCVNLDYLK